jgi:hypothetical protein
MLEQLALGDAALIYRRSAPQSNPRFTSRVKATPEY